MAVTPTRFLAAGSDDTALALKVYSGVFNEAWRNQPKLYTAEQPVIHKRSAAGSKSYQFLKFAETPNADESYRPGGDLAGQAFAVDEGTNSVDDGYVIAHHRLPRDHTVVSHFEVWAQLARADARQVGMVLDRRLFTTACLAARAPATTKNGLTVDSGGNRVTRSGGSVAAAYPRSATGAANFRADLRQLARLMDEDNVPPETRWLWYTPYMNEVLLYDNTAQVFSRDYATNGNDISTRTVRVIEGFKVVDERVNTRTNGGSFPDSNIVTGPARYQGDFSIGASTGTPVALALCQGPDGGAAVTMGNWEDVQNIVHYDPETLSWFMASFVLGGISQMNPYCAGSVEVII